MAEQLADVTSEKLEQVPVNDSHDWVNLTDGTFQDLMAVCSTTRSRTTEQVTHRSALGLTTNCDTYVYSFAYDDLVKRVKDLIEEYEYSRRQVELGRLTIEEATQKTTASLEVIKWTATLKQSLRTGKEIEFDESRIREVLYRPFTKLWLYEDARILSSVKTISKMFPRDTETDIHLRERENPRPHAEQPRRMLNPRNQAPRRSQQHGSEPGRSKTHSTQAILITGGSTRGLADAYLVSEVMPDLNCHPNGGTRAILRSLAADLA